MTIINKNPTTNTIRPKNLDYESFQYMCSAQIKIIRKLCISATTANDRPDFARDRFRQNLSCSVSESDYSYIFIRNVCLSCTFDLEMPFDRYTLSLEWTCHSNSNFCQTALVLDLISASGTLHMFIHCFIPTSVQKFVQFSP